MNFVHQEFDTKELQKCIEDLVRLEKDWVPTSPNSSLYIRPTMIGTDVIYFFTFYTFSLVFKDSLKKFCQHFSI